MDCRRAVGPVCVLRAEALTHNLTAMAGWCRDRGVELAPHGKTHMAPQLFARQLDAGACGITAATLSQVRTYRAFGVRDVVLANELVDGAGLRWLAAELDAHPDFSMVCWVDSVRGVELMTAALTARGRSRPVDVCVEVGMAGGRTGCRGTDAVDEVARAAAASPRLRLVGVAGLRGGARSRHRARRAGRRHRLPAGDARRGGAAGPAVRDGPSDRDRGRQHVLRRGRRRADR